jgi:hypothetical protein
MQQIQNANANAMSPPRSPQGIPMGKETRDRFNPNPRYKQDAVERNILPPAGGKMNLIQKTRPSLDQVNSSYVNADYHQQ